MKDFNFSLVAIDQIINNAAKEPEVVDLADCLIRMGAKIKGQGTDKIVIEGVKTLQGCDFSVMPDRVETATYLTAVAMTGGDITIKGTRPDSIDSVVNKLKEAGALINSGEDWISLKMEINRPKATSLSTGPFPSFPTDMQAQMCALFSVTPGISVVKETIFPSRFMHVPELKRMGANISLNDSTAVIRGVDQLSAAPVMASDLRASAALVLAGLAAEGTTEINRLYHIDRGYEYIDRKLEAIGAKLRRGS